MATDPDPSPMPFAGDEGPANVNALWARVLVDELARAGLAHVVIAPGSRSAPLVFEFAGHPDIADYSVIDERSAAFFALGMSRALGEPVALLCTSGTAAANFMPAICEADADDVPLLVMTADRPPEDHECGTQQTMDQVRLYGSHVRWFHDMSQPEADPDKLAYLRSLACRAWHLTRSGRPGPVHVNTRFRKPLEPLAPDPGERGSLASREAVTTAPAAAGRPGRAPWLRMAFAPRTPAQATVADLARRLRDSRRPLIVAGADGGAHRYREALRDFAENSGIPVIAEATSNLRHWSERGQAVLGAGELMAARGVFDDTPPDLVLHTGRAPVTWALQRAIASATDAVHVRIAPNERIIDPDHSLCEQIVAEPRLVFEALASGPCKSESADGAWLAELRRTERRFVEALDRSMSDSEGLSAPRFWHELGALLPEHCALHFSSSMLVRHLETFLCGHSRSLDVFFNRGLNGIDGVVSTAAGIATARRRTGSAPAPTVLVIGDVALRHDVAALLLAEEMALDLTVVVIDNDGGEIFDYLPSAGFGDIHEKHFATSGGTPLARVLPAGLSMDQPADWAELRTSITRSLERRGLGVIRVATDRRQDVRLRRALLDADE
ncbi:MAG: 2-succinyl-5-enolpyruvyl-6-hydroxy-3-cyclohexene-1-carboxylic-acid synthase [Candidatus Wenzhouxiangella sp. M2_3B_020]